MIYERGGFQDVVDKNQVHDKLVATLGEFWPGIKPDGSCDGYTANFWHTENDALSEYAAMVLVLARAAAKERLT